MKRINPIARILNATFFRNRVKPNKKKYNKKRERQKNVKENSLQIRNFESEDS